MPLTEPFFEFRYTDDWYPLTDGKGHSLVLVDPRSSQFTWSTGEAWRPSWKVNGSPGTADTADPDINGDHVLDGTDLNLLCGHIKQGALQYDFTSDGAVNGADLRYFVEKILGTSVGDANLDGQFDSNDLVAIFIAGQYDDGIAGNSTWETGDWNCDGEFDSGDLVAAFASGAYVTTNAGSVSEELSRLAVAAQDFSSGTVVPRNRQLGAHFEVQIRQVERTVAAHDRLFDSLQVDNVEWMSPDHDKIYQDLNLVDEEGTVRDKVLSTMRLLLEPKV